MALSADRVRIISGMFRTGLLAGSLLLAACASQGDGRRATAARESDACRFVPAAEVDAVEPLYATVHEHTSAQKRLLGAKLLVRPAPGITAESLDRAVECHVARRVDEPLEIAVKRTAAGFEVDVVAPTIADAREVLARAHAFARASAAN